MKIVIPGGTGQIGTVLNRALHAEHEIVVLSRHPVSNDMWRSVPWDGKNAGPWIDELDGADVVINLPGRSVNCRYNEKNRREILESRVDSVRAIGNAIKKVKRPPNVWLS